MSYKVKKAVILNIIIVFILTFLICFYMLIKNYLYFEKAKIETTQLLEDVIEISQEGEDNLVDWDKLKTINKDIIGWIKINDTQINYPIIYDENTYYLSHTYEKKYNINGSIFTQTINPFESKETLIHGHNNQNGIMFSEIENFMNQDFFDKHQTFTVYTKSANYDAKIFSIYSIDVNEEINNIKNLTFEECIEYYKKQSKFKTQNEETAGNIIKLSTCSYLNNKTTPTNQRYYLVAYLTKC